ncbi:MAG: HEPN domain-containing protein [Bacteroidetes bacterium]|nr:HEPN domain-containing protein [Bacteroidota bacterium]MBU1718533.1 HEPN domain-containing protein [Bacteroidota bacterium]
MNQEDRMELVKYRIAKSKETYKEVAILVENKLYNTAVNRLYYACYYAVIALLISKEISATTHAGVRSMFGLHFVKSGIVEKNLGKFFSDIFDMRQTGDYEDFIEFTQEDVLDLLEPAEKLIMTIEFLVRTN